MAANQIETISGLAFLGLNNLGSLFLTRNKIEKLPRDALFGLNSLTRLFLNENKVTINFLGVTDCRLNGTKLESDRRF